MSGTPIVALGPSLGNGVEPLYEVHDLITYGVDGYWADSQDNLIRMCSLLMENDKLATSISKAGRAKAIELFSEEKIKPQWEEFFKTL
jgi:glycosyltransferase involved in cell wall biosynthesis